MKPPRTRNGFTLIEIVIAIAILAILSAIVIPRVVGRVEDARVARAKSDIQALGTALNLYKLDNFAYPSTEQGLEALVSKPAGSPEARNWKQGGYIERLPKDPWGNDYQYISPGQRGEVDVYSLGADAQLGGEGPAADVGNWND
ncbi:MAG TPA: type II secretion system major pseudopilin GspG [Xanthomonadales bacterium]|nr:type II secretion system major pseudopilin GspG [Xanthomonadales bacterium]